MGLRSSRFGGGPDRRPIVHGPILSKHIRRAEMRARRYAREIVGDEPSGSDGLVGPEEGDVQYYLFKDNEIRVVFDNGTEGWIFTSPNGVNISAGSAMVDYVLVADADDEAFILDRVDGSVIDSFPVYASGVNQHLRVVGNQERFLVCCNQSVAAYGYDGVEIWRRDGLVNAQETVCDAEGAAYANNSSSTTSYKVVKLSAVDGTTVWSYVHPDGVDFNGELDLDGDYNLYAASPETGELFKIDATGSLVWRKPLESVRGVCVSQDGRVFAAGTSSGADVVWELDPVNGDILVESADVGSFRHLAIDNYSRVLVSDGGGGASLLDADNGLSVIWGGVAWSTRNVDCDPGPTNAVRLS